MKLVIHPPVDPRRLELIREAAGPMEVVNAASHQAAVEAMPDADAFFGKITPAVLAASGKLQWVQSPTASLEHYIFPELVEHRCSLTNMRGLFSDIIADQVLGYVICFARNLHVYIRQQTQAVWQPVGGESERAGFAHGPGTVTALDREHLHLAGMTMGIIGLGSIGSEVARRALAFGISVVAVDPVQTEKPDESVTLWRLDRTADLLAASDFVVIAAPHTPRTEKSFRRPQLEQMKPTAYLINIGRGAIVDLNDLTEALRTRRIAGAALDVFEIEPLPPDHPLWRMENAILTPHVAGYSPRIAERHLEVLLDNIGRFRRGEPLRNVVNKAEWY